MISDEMKALKHQLENEDPANDQVFFDLVGHSIKLLGLPTNDVAKALGVSVKVVEGWYQRTTPATFALRPWVYRYFIKQITLRNEITSYHASDDYGYKYHFDSVDSFQLSKLTIKLTVCSRFLDKMQLSYAPPKMRLSFFTDSTKGGDYAPIEELHHLIAEMGGYPEVHIKSGEDAVVIPLTKKEKSEPKSELQLSTRHCYELKDGCRLQEPNGRCSCSCCLLEKVAAVPILSCLG